VWEKVKEHCGAKGLPPGGAVMSMEGWTIQREVMTFVECRGYNYKGTKTGGRVFWVKHNCAIYEGCKEA